jgi:hypothetical protein
MRIGNVWGSLRGIIRNNFSFAQIKDLVGAAGLPIHNLSHLHQKPPNIASKGQLMDAIDRMVTQLLSEDQDRFVVSCIAEILTHQSGCRPELELVLSRIGWGIIGTEPHPFRLQIDLETSELDAPIREGIVNCLRRYRDGDISGSMTAICGIVDSLTEKIYSTNDLGDHKKDTYQQRVVRSFSSLENKFKQPLALTNIPESENNIIWHNYRGSINQAAYVLSSFRREFSDTHGWQSAPSELIQRGLDCAVFIVRSIAILI